MTSEPASYERGVGTRDKSTMPLARIPLGNGRTISGKLCSVMGSYEFVTDKGKYTGTLEQIKQKLREDYPAQKPEGMERKVN